MVNNLFPCLTNPYFIAFIEALSECYHHLKQGRKPVEPNWAILFNSSTSERWADVLNPLQKALLGISDNKGPKVILFCSLVIRVMEGGREEMSKGLQLTHNFLNPSVNTTWH